MNKSDLDSEINRFNSEVDIDSATTPPKSWYARREFEELDNALLKSHWQFVGHTDFLKAPKNYFSGQFAGESYIVVKDKDNNISAFHNVCRHHAAPLVEGSGHVEELVCPYHAWCYSLSGNLKRAPQMGGIKNFDREAMGLRPIALQLWGPFILLNFSEKPKNLDLEYKGLLDLLISTDIAPLQFIERKAYEIKCNWKVYIDNYLDGGYHVDHLHKGLAGQLDMDNYRVKDFKTYTVQSCAGAEINKTSIDGVDFRERIGGEALYIWIHPNFMINRYGSIMDTNWIVPLGHDRCVTIFDYYFDTEKLDRTFIEASIKASEQVQKEDVIICEQVQRGLGSSSYDVGRYAPKLESGAYLFHRLVKDDYLRIKSKRT